MLPWITRPLLYSAPLSVHGTYAICLCSLVVDDEICILCNRQCSLRSAITIKRRFSHRIVIKVSSKSRQSCIIFEVSSKSHQSLIKVSSKSHQSLRIFYICASSVVSSWCQNILTKPHLAPRQISMISLIDVSSKLRPHIINVSSKLRPHIINVSSKLTIFIIVVSSKFSRFLARSHQSQLSSSPH